MSHKRIGLIITFVLTIFLASGCGVKNGDLAVDIDSEIAAGVAATLTAEAAQTAQAAPDQSAEVDAEETVETGELEEPGDISVIVEDQRSDGENGSWTTRHIVGGVWADTWFVNQYERPFSAYEMIYQPHLDITEARVRPAGDWKVFEIQAVEPAAGKWVYISLELDTDLDNRPDFLILTRAVEDTIWNDQMITISIDPNRDVGGNRARLAEPFDEEWNGFDQVYQTDQNHAYVRLSPDSSSIYQVAVSDAILGDTFIWRAWLEGEIYHPGWVEYHDRVSLEEAGSPYQYSPNYPLKNLASMDNTCLHFFGGETVQPQPGFCGTIIELSGEDMLPPDDQFANPTGENPVSIIFPSGDPGDEDDGPDPTLMVFDPGYFFQPTPTPLPHLNEFPTLEFVVPPPREEGAVIAVVDTPYVAVAVEMTPVYAESVPVPTVVGYGVVEETEMFDPYAGSTPPPTEMFDPYQGSSPTPTPKPVIQQLPTATPKPVIHIPTKTPTRITIQLP